MEKVVLITGVTAHSLGASLLLKVAALPGYKVYGTLRNIQQKKEALLKEAQEKGVEPNFELIEMDVTDPEAAQKVIQTVVAKQGRLDILVNNAGAGLLQTVEGTPIKKVYDNFEVNFFGVYRMIQAALPTMRQQQYGRIINVSSIGGIVGQPFNEGYCAAKAAVDSLGESMNANLREFNIRVSTFCPGAIQSNFVGQTLNYSDPQDFPPAYEGLLGKYKTAITARFNDPNYKNYVQTPEMAADDILTIIQTENPQARYITKQAQVLADLKFTDQTGEKVVGFFQNYFK